MNIFDHDHSKITESNFSFPEYVPTCKKSDYSICSFFEISQFLSPMTRLATRIFDHSNQKKNCSAFNFCESVLTCKKSIILSVHSTDTDTILEPCHKTGPHPFLTMPTPKIFKHLFICMNLYQHAKNQLIPSIHSRDTVNFRVL